MLYRIVGRHNRSITALTAASELSVRRSSIVTVAVVPSSSSLQSTSCTLYTPISCQQHRTYYNTTFQQATPLSSSSITYNQYYTQYKTLVSISPPSVVRYMSTSIDTSKSKQDDTNNRGEELYQKAMSALTKASTAKQKHEEDLLEEQFEAMEKQRIKTQQRQANRKNSNDPRLQRLNDIDAQSDENDCRKGGGINDRAAGVAVVRTIVKQSNKARDDIIQKKIHVEQSSAAKSNNNNNESEEHYQQLAQQYMEEAAFRYGHPLALVRLGNEALTYSKNSSNDDIKPLFDTERMTSWILESPIKLGAALAFIEDKSYNVLALQLYQEAGKQGSSEGWYNFAHMLWEGSVVSDDISWSDGATDKEKAIDAFHKAIELQDADAMYFVAAQYLNYEEDDDGDENENENNLLAKCYEVYGPEFLLKLKADGLENEWDTFMEKSIQPDDDSNTSLNQVTFIL